MSNVRDILTDLGYRLQQQGNSFRCAANFRNGDNPTSLLIGEGGGFTDFAHPENSGSFKKLISLTLGKPYHEVDKFLKNKKYEELDISREEVDLSNTYPTLFDEFQYGTIVPDHTYWLNRDVPENVIKYFRGGVIKETSRLWGRYVFPIFARDGKRVNGFAARKLKDDMSGPKWYCRGKKGEWEYPLFLTEKYIREKREIIICESIGDTLNFCKAGIKQILTPIGIASFQKLSLLCIEFNPEKIIIAFNNDKETQAGNKAADKLQKTLLNFFKKDRVKVSFPPFPFNDFGEMSDKDIQNWYMANC